MTADLERLWRVDPTPRTPEHPPLIAAALAPDPDDDDAFRRAIVSNVWVWDRPILGWRVVGVPLRLEPYRRGALAIVRANIRGVPDDIRAMRTRGGWRSARSSGGLAEPCWVFAWREAAR